MSINNDQFLKDNPLEIINVLRELQKRDAPISISWPGKQCISKILKVTDGSLIIDFSSHAADNEALQHASKIKISAENHGAKIEFSLPQLQVTHYLNLPAFSSSLPSSLRFIQRREYFRIEAPLQATFHGSTKFDDGIPFIFPLRDISLGGVGALLDKELPTALQEGQCFEQVELDFASFGKLCLNMQLVTISERKIINRKNETVAVPRLGFRFLGVTPSQERQLQLIIFALERTAREKYNRVR
ncbi:flagellar brake protein [Buttiauxella warmboldiae]|uniref:Flagellar brake protein YcgR n=1 Tax=Buttiauxella warmboldiae TaxID=82993 RepID=A0A3N5DKQ7_9ENTR|nr:flagellar brake protein [Buttiauxella warmboldiae]RPH29225.1 flagellar brake protein [Buttiauxella warmboldiae]